MLRNEVLGNAQKKSVVTQISACVRMCLEYDAARANSFPSHDARDRIPETTRGRSISCFTVTTKERRGGGP
jgi:hypothetical protein